MQLKQFLWDSDIIRCYLFFIAEMYNLQFFASSLPHHVICANLPDFPGKLPIFQLPANQKAKSNFFNPEKNF